MPQLTNFGRTVRWTPRHAYVPRDADEVVRLLDRHAGGRVRAMGAGHSWSALCATDDVALDLRQLRDVRVDVDAAGRAWATIGGGCPVWRALAELRRLGGWTLPAVGAITRQTIAGATATGTHGSGRPSLSHHLAAVRVAAYGDDGRARVVEHDAGDALRAARCALGCMGVVLDVRLPVVREYRVAGSLERCATLAEVLAGEAAHPLQAFILFPWSWDWVVWRRRVVAEGERPSGALRRLVRHASNRLGTDVGLHAVLRATLALPDADRRVRALYRTLLPRLIRPEPPVADRAARVLTLHHEYWRHLEMELFVPASRLALALDVARHLVATLAGDDDAGPHVAPARAALADAGLLDELARLRGSYVAHYPLFCRRVLPDDTLVSMAAGGDEPWYTISLFHYARDDRRYLAAASLLARALRHACGGRPHWGKIFPLGPDDVAALYPALPAFRAECERADPRGVFRNAHVGRLLGFDAAAATVGRQ